MTVGEKIAKLRTEPVIRVMVESESREACVEYAECVADAIVNGGHCAE